MVNEPEPCKFFLKKHSGKRMAKRITNQTVQSVVIFRYGFSYFQFLSG